MTPSPQLPKLSTLSPEQKNVLIAPLCGWTHCVLRMPESNNFELFSAPSGIDPDPDYKGERRNLPDYARSLDACAEMRKALRENQFHYVDYPKELFLVVTGMKWDGDIGYFMFCYVDATPEQHVDAALLATGKAEL